MSIPNKQIGWSQESNLLWYILKQLNKLTAVISKIAGGNTPSYKVWTGTVGEDPFTGPQVVAVFENTLGGPVTLINTPDGGPYDYQLKSNNLFVEGATFVIVGLSPNGAIPVYGSAPADDASTINLFTNGVGPIGNNSIEARFIEIRVYN